MHLVMIQEMVFIGLDELVGMSAFIAVVDCRMHKLGTQNFVGVELSGISILCFDFLHARRLI